MDWIKLVVDQIITVVDEIVIIIRFFITDPLGESTDFRDGFITALITGFILGSISTQILIWRAQIRTYFTPIRIPATNSGLRPVDIYVSCLGALMKIGVTLALLLFVVIALLFR
jgi:hypothetical protein